ncbi:hypothetical protein [Nocardia sp. NPDC051570]|uniref:aggregation-promoting factor C-terminal-like domain-containing protein n=1 Tax=Nocardia sp. NPDC051570 TaxID=3364324 RepID=UPI003791E041
MAVATSASACMLPIFLATGAQADTTPAANTTVTQPANPREPNGIEPVKPTGSRATAADRTPILAPNQAPGTDDAAAPQGLTDTALTLNPNLLSSGLDLMMSAIELPPHIIAKFIVPPDQWYGFDQVISHESGWNTFAVNPSSGAYGLGQALPATKMFTQGWDWPINPVTQLLWTYDYMCQRYGSPNAAWAFWQVHHWY